MRSFKLKCKSKSHHVKALETVHHNANKRNEKQRINNNESFY